MILSGSPALIWEWKVLVCRDSHQQIGFADFFFFFASRNQLGMRVRRSAGRRAADCPVEPCADRRGCAGEFHCAQELEGTELPPGA